LKKSLIRYDSSFYKKYGKRAVDVILSTLALLALSPVFWLTIILIHLNSSGTPFFFQRRFGKGITPFRLIKFRSMVTVPYDSEKEFKPGCSMHVSIIGRILRKTKIDELPALFNVLWGEMSIIGPRPEVEKYIQAYPEDFKAILKMRPGLSDFASIKYRYEEMILAGHPDPDRHYLNVILPDKLRLANKYIEEASFSTDLRLISDTLKAIPKSASP
jgi:lipopolysaccharide/colanic/teichoic acid biosynthesis glycosyltransferase